MKRPGRPRLDPTAHTVPVHLKLSAAQYDATWRRAQRDGVTVPERIRRDITAAQNRKTET